MVKFVRSGLDPDEYGFVNQHGLSRKVRYSALLSMHARLKKYGPAHL
jgi:hypothetical protein